MGDLNDLIGEPISSNNSSEPVEIRKEIDIVKCPNCGANMVFDPAKQKLYCEHCESVIDFNSSQNISERDFSLRESDTASWDDTIVIRCTNCGNTQVISRTDIATVCPFCFTGNIVKTEELAGIKPGAVFPFTVTREQCLAASKKWLRRKIFAPSACKRTANLENFKGVYSPAWTFDSKTVTNYSGVFGKYYTRTVGSGKNRRTVTEVRYFNVSGVYNLEFDDIVIEASPAIDGDTFKNLGRFKRECAVVYDQKYLAGFSANHYDKKIDIAFTEAKGFMKSQIELAIKRHYNADVVRSLTTNIYHNNVTFKYILLPIWIGHFTYKHKNYNYFTNGNTAKVAGKVPISPIKVTIFSSIMLVLVGGACVAVYYFNGGFDRDRSQLPATEIRCEVESAESYELEGYSFKF